MKTSAIALSEILLLSLAISTATAAESPANIAPEPARSEAPESSHPTAHDDIDPHILARAKAKLARTIQISHRFDADAAIEGSSDERWRSDLVGRLMQADDADFAAIEGSASLIDAIGAATRAAGKAKKPAGTAKSLGDAAQDLTYIPINPCRILDTRKTAGASFSAGQTRTYSFNSINAGAGNCSVYGAYSGTQRPKAIAANVTIDATAYTGYGPGNYLAIYPQGGSAGTSFLNYGAGAVAANAGVLSINESNGLFSALASAPAQVIIDVFGVFVPPEPTELECQNLTSSPRGVAAGSFSNVTSPSCPAGYTHTGGACNADDESLSAGTVDFSTTAPYTFCFYRNTDTAAAHNISAVATCCRVPGRN